MKILKQLALAVALACGLLSTASADLGGGLVLALLSNSATTGSQFTWPGGEGMLDVSGTYNGATVTLQYSPDGATWNPVGSGCVINSSTIYPNCRFHLARMLIRAAISGAGGSTSLTVKIWN